MRFSATGTFPTRGYAGQGQSPALLLAQPPLGVGCHNLTPQVSQQPQPPQVRRAHCLCPPSALHRLYNHTPPLCVTFAVSSLLPTVTCMLCQCLLCSSPGRGGGLAVFCSPLGFVESTRPSPTPPLSPHEPSLLTPASAHPHAIMCLFASHLGAGA